jgi:hypothetical protein|tara:strand:- start:324 stop:530 length:207 start_codon:yes stop_codon:yes gene_type:complete
MKLTHIIEQPEGPPPINLQAIEGMIDQVVPDPAYADEIRQAIGMLGSGRQLTREHNQVILTYLTMISG